MPTKWQVLYQERTDLRAEGQKLLDKAERTEAEDARLAEITQRVSELNVEIETEERAREAMRQAPAQPATRITGVRDLSLERPWGYDLAPQNPQSLALGDYLSAVVRAGQGKGIDGRLMATAQGAGSAQGADGAFLMHTTMSNRIMSRVMTGSILSRLNPLPLDAGSDTLAINVLDETSLATGSRFGGVTGYWIDQGTAPTASRPKFSRIELKLRGLAALGYATNELLRNVTALQGWFEQFFSQELRFLGEDAALNGVGAGQPVGFSRGACKVTVAKEGGQGAATIVKENIDKMWARRYADNTLNYVWMINQECEPQLDDLQMVVGTAGVPVYMPPGGLADTPYGRLKGRPVIPVPYAAALGTEGDIALVDWSQYAWIQEAGVENASSIHVAFTTNETAFRATWYVDGQPGWKSALTPFKGTSTLSPMITLATRA